MGLMNYLLVPASLLLDQYRVCGEQGECIVSLLIFVV